MSLTFCSMIPANARNSDPITSVLAGEAIEQSGEAQIQRMKVLAAVKAHPGLTSKELAAEAGLDRYMVARRLPEIFQIEKGESRKCRVGRFLSLTWWPK